MPDHLNHTHLAELLDRAHAAAVALDRALAVAGLASWPIDSPRRYSLAALEQLAGTRETLDRLAVAAGLASPYLRRDLKPNAYTRAAAREAQPWPYATSEHTNLDRVHRRGTPTPVTGPGLEGCGTGYDDHDPSLHKPQNEIASVPPPSATHASPSHATTTNRCAQRAAEYVLIDCTRIYQPAATRGITEENHDDQIHR